jgi:hypothetical protein
LGPASVFTPSIDQAASQTVLPALLGGAQVYAPRIDLSISVSLLGGATVAPPQIDLQVRVSLLGGSLLYSPTVVRDQFVTPGRLGGSQIFAPSFSLQVYPDLLGGAIVFDPSLELVIRPTLLGPAVVFSPVVITDQFVAVTRLGGATLYVPKVKNPTPHQPFEATWSVAPMAATYSPSPFMEATYEIPPAPVSLEAAMAAAQIGYTPTARSMDWKVRHIRQGSFTAEAFIT